MSGEAEKGVVVNDAEGGAPQAGLRRAPKAS